MGTINTPVLKRMQSNGEGLKAKTVEHDRWDRMDAFEQHDVKQATHHTRHAKA